MFSSAVILILIAIAGLIFVVVDTARGKGRFGVNSNQINCPTCGEPLPALRKPKSINQALWGGWTCESCQTEADKWGNIIDSNSVNKDKPRQIDDDKTEFLKPFDERGKTPVEKVFDEK